MSKKLVQKKSKHLYNFNSSRRHDVSKDQLLDNCITCMMEAITIADLLDIDPQKILDDVHTEYKKWRFEVCTELGILDDNVIQFTKATK